MASMQGNIERRRLLNIDSADLVHPVRRLFGQSSGAAWGAIVVIVLLSMMLVRPIANSVLSWHRTAGLLAERRTEVTQLRREHRQLKSDLAFYDTDQFVVEQARTFGMVFPGEQTYVLREVVHPESAARFAIARVRNATVDHKLPVS
jgi:hypothetical protein